MSRLPRRIRILVAVLASLPLCAAATQQSEGPADTRADGAAGVDDTDSVLYPAAFFTAYRPVTALDMVRQLPGFQLSQGGGGRGFGGSAGNVLIDGERPSSKQDSLSAILQRIPAERVVRIELIRGNTAQFDAAGQSEIANVVVDSARRSWAWDGTVEQDLDSGGPTPGGSLSVVDKRGRIDWGGGLVLATRFIGNTADEQRIEDGSVVEDRDEFERRRSQSLRLNGNAATQFQHSTLRVNGELRYQNSDFKERSTRMPVATSDPAFDLNQRSDSDEWRFELGIDYEWSGGENWSAKAIGLHSSEIEDDRDRELFGAGQSEPELRRVADSDSIESESIGRLEFDWFAVSDHFVELDVETALNSLDNDFALQVRADGDLVPVEVPGANNRVEELRGDIQIRDTWQLGDYSLESALGAEASEIRQSRGRAPDQQFFFFKPSLTLVHAPDTGLLNRINFSRRIAQLSFGDFISSTNFFDDDVDRGNPELEPQQTWLAEMSSERRFGAIGAAKITAFHRWVQDVQDRLPIDGEFEVPGNIGDGRSWGVQFETTVPLMPLGLKQSRLDLDARWQDSEVTDPVTGRSRRFSGQREYIVESEFRQDLLEARWAWGFETQYLDRSLRFELDELDINDQGFGMDAFVETTRYFGMKFQMTAENLLNREFLRDRTVFTDARGSSEPAFRELRDRRRGRSVLLSVSGSF